MNFDEGTIVVCNTWNGCAEWHDPKPIDILNICPHIQYNCARCRVEDHFPQGLLKQTTNARSGTTWWRRPPVSLGNPPAGLRPYRVDLPPGLRDREGPCGGEISKGLGEVLLAARSLRVSRGFAA